MPVERIVIVGGGPAGLATARSYRECGDGAFAIWYQREGGTVGVLTHERDGDYEQGRELIANGEPPP